MYIRIQKARKLIPIVFLAFIFASPKSAWSITKIELGERANSASSFPTLNRDGRYLTFTNASHTYRYDRTTQELTLLSSLNYVDSNESSSPQISSDGEHACYTSVATDLVDNDTNGYSDAFAVDIEELDIERVNVGPAGVQANGVSILGCAISDGGRYVAFDSRADNLIDGYAGGIGQLNLYLRDRVSGETSIINHDPDGDPAYLGGPSNSPSITPDGRFIAFASAAQDILPEDTNEKTDIYVYDRESDLLEIVSKDSEGVLANGNSSFPKISANGRFVVFRSNASNLVSDDTNGYEDVFVHDRQTGETSRVSISSSGVEQNNTNWFDLERRTDWIARPGISDNGRFVVYASNATNLDQGDTNSERDVFVHDRQNRITRRVNIAFDGSQANDESRYVTISGNGYWVAFDSYANNLVPDDTDAFFSGIFVVRNPLSDGLEDSDLDGVLDADEIIAGTDPFDRGSNLPILGQTVCSEWNGFFQGGMYNIMEHVNLSFVNLNVGTKIFDIFGNEQDAVSFDIEPGAQFDLLVHGMNGRQSQSYGQVCSSHDGLLGSLDGRMVYYKPSVGTADPTGDFDFAFSMSFSNGKPGTQFVPYNTFQPSLNSIDANNPVANWIQLTNPSESSQIGSMHFYDISGIELQQVDVTLAPGERRDFSGHQFGANLVGVIEWRPLDRQVPFQLRNVRYYYDSANVSSESFTTAAQFEGQVGSGRELVVPLDAQTGSAILEISNTINRDVVVTLRISSALGSELDSRSFTLGAYASTHIITDGILNNGRGIARVRGSERESLVATAMHYGRDADARIKYIYGIPSREPLGSNLRGSYNSFIRQGCDLILANPTSENQSVKISMIRGDGTNIFSDISRTVWANGLINFDLCSSDSPNEYGVVHLKTEIPNSVVGTVIRRGKNDQYRFATDLRQ